MTVSPIKSFSYPLSVQCINLIIKSYVNSYWKIIDLLASKFQFLSHFFYDHTIKDEYHREHQSVKLTKTDSILHIGCGMYPYSAMVLATRPHHRIVAIDTNDSIIKQARKIISDFNLDRSIQVDIGDGSSYDLKPFTVIVVSSCVDLSNHVLDHILSTSNKKTRIILRELKPMNQILKQYLQQRHEIRITHQFSTFSFPFFTIFGWDTYIIEKLS